MLKFKKLSEYAVIPTRGTEQAAGFDLYSPKDFSLYGGQTKLINTDIACIFPSGFYGDIRPRSSLAKKGIVTQGVIDEDYTGSIGAVLINTNHPDSPPIIFAKGDRIAQMLILAYYTGESEEVFGEFPQTKRGANGFGSTGR